MLTPESKPESESKDLSPAAVLEAALHSHLQGIAARPMTARMLGELEKTCGYARALLALGQDPAAVSPTYGGNFMPGVGMGPVVSSYGESPSDYGLPAYSAPAETFGAQAIRQLLELVPSLIQKPAPSEPARSSNAEDMTKAILLAKLNGETELECELRSALRKELAPTTASPLPLLAEAAE